MANFTGHDGCELCQDNLKQAESVPSGKLEERARATIIVQDGAVRPRGSVFEQSFETETEATEFAGFLASWMADFAREVERETAEECGEIAFESDTNWSARDGIRFKFGLKGRAYFTSINNNRKNRQRKVPLGIRIRRPTTIEVSLAFSRASRRHPK
jgi:hypothetical protein